ncbi:sulfite oxidase [Actinophytocola sp.]|uniref:sulfite oxidase n=1 Tax=Actinophytocola sp. TaxID=1872138 RepID=UPI002ED67215
MDLTDEATYDRARMWDRRTFLRLTGLTATVAPLWTSTAAADTGPIVKPLPAETFDVHGTNAETRWGALAGTGNLVPIDRFFVRNHTRTPLLSADTWRLQLFGTGLRGAPTADNPVEFSYQDLLYLPAETVTARIECAGNGRSFYTTQQNQTVSGTPWRLGAVGVARWRGVRLATVLERAGLRASAVDVLPQGLDPDFVAGGVNLGPVRRPLPVRKALEDVLIAYEMNGEPLPPDHGFPARLVVPDWIGIASIKWLGRIEVSDSPLVSPWNTQFYRFVGPDYPPEGELVSKQNTKSAFELPWNSTLAAGRTHHLTGRSWSGTGGVRKVEVSTDGGRSWRCATPHGQGRGWLRWTVPWRPTDPGSYTLRARATDRTGAVQPDIASYNTQGYLFGAVVHHPVTVT